MNKWLQKAIALLLGLLMCLVVLELSLRLVGSAFLYQQEQQNVKSLKRQNAYRVLCVGESTTALGGDGAYPHQLEEILNKRGSGTAFSVINKGIPGGHSTAILRDLPANLETYKPDIVVAMMGANDGRAGAIADVPQTPAQKVAAPQNSGGTGIEKIKESEEEPFYKSLKVYRFFRQLRHNWKKKEQKKQKENAGHPTDALRLPLVASSLAMANTIGTGTAGDTSAPPRQEGPGHPGYARPPQNPGGPEAMGHPGGPGGPEAMGHPGGPGGPKAMGHPGGPGGPEAMGHPGGPGGPGPATDGAPGQPFHPGAPKMPGAPLPMANVNAHQECRHLAIISDATEAGLSEEELHRKLEGSSCHVFDELLDFIQPTLADREALDIPTVLASSTDPLALLDTWVPMPTHTMGGKMKIISNEYERFGRTEELNALIAKSFARFPEDAGFFVEIGRFLTLMGAIPAIEHKLLLKAQALDPDNAGIDVLLGRSFQRLEEYDAAQAAYAKAVAQSPRWFAGLLALAESYWHKGDTGEADEAFEKASHACEGECSKDINSQVALGTFLYRADRFEEAEGYFRKAIELNEKSVAALTLLAKSCLAQDKDDDAEKALKRALELLPSCPQYAELVRLYEKQGAHKKIEALFKSIKNPYAFRGTYDCFTELVAHYYQRQGKEELADQLYQRYQYFPPTTSENYRKMKKMLEARDIRLVAVQYPGRNLTPLKALFDSNDDVVFVDNEKVFHDAVDTYGYDAIFWDDCYGDFGHATRKGNRILAENVADVILKTWF